MNIILKRVILIALFVILSTSIIMAVDNFSIITTKINNNIIEKQGDNYVFYKQEKITTKQKLLDEKTDVQNMLNEFVADRNYYIEEHTQYFYATCMETYYDDKEYQKEITFKEMDKMCKEFSLIQAQEDYGMGVIDYQEQLKEVDNDLSSIEQVK